MDLDAFRWLLTEPGQALLARAATVYVEHAGDPVRTATALRREADPAHATAALTQVDLRARAVPKFGDDAARMYFTPDGLEQATHLRVATHRAARGGVRMVSTSSTSSSTRSAQPMTARTSRPLRMRYSSPPYLTSVPPYLL